MEKKPLLTSKKNKNGTYNLLTQYCKEGAFLKSTGVTVRLNSKQVEFFKRHQRLPSNVPNYELFNQHLEMELDKLEGIIKRFKSTYSHYPTKSELESYIMFCSGNLQSESEGFIECLSKFIEKKSLSKDVKQYVTLYNHLKEFLVWKNMEGKKIHFSSLQTDFFKEFFTFLSLSLTIRYEGRLHRKKGMCDNAISKFSYSLASAIKQIKKYKIADYDRDLIKDNIRLACEELNITQYENKELVLSHHEMEILTNFTPIAFAITHNGKTLKTVSGELLNRIKYLFILQTVKGTRHSDLNQLNVNNVFDKRVYVKQKKTGFQYNVKVDDSTISLMKKANSETPISNQKYNMYLKILFKQFFPYYKELYKKDDIDYRLDGIKVVKYYLGVEKIEYKYRYEMIKSHTARRSYVSVAKIKHGLSDLEIQHDIGQTNPMSLQPYKIYYEEIERPSVFDLRIDEKNSPTGDKKQSI